MAERRRVIAGGDRLDRLIASEDLSRSQAAKLIAEGLVRVNGQVVIKPSFQPHIGDEVVVDLPNIADTPPQAEDIPLSLVYEDEALAVVVKPAGMVVHPAPGSQSGTLVNALLYRMEALSALAGEDRPGIVHRLDKDTSGLIIVAKDDQTHQALSRQLAERRMQKTYLAVVQGKMKDQQGEIRLPIRRNPKDRKKMAVVPGGRDALTRWTLMEQRKDRALLCLDLVTGRTHQIRVHMAHIGHPVLGDPLYGRRDSPKAPRLMLHAWRLCFTHPKTQERLQFEAPPDPIFKLPDPLRVKLQKI